MANNEKYSHSLLDLDNRISKEIEFASRELSDLEVKNTNKYIEFNYHRLNHIQDLFDEASDIIKELDITKLTGDIPAILRAKKNIQSNFGAFQEVQRIWKELIEEPDKEKDIGKDEHVLERTLEEPNPMLPDDVIIDEDQPVPEFIPSPEFDDEMLLNELDAQEALEEKAKEKAQKEKDKKKKQQEERANREKEAREAYISEQARNQRYFQQLQENSRKSYEENQRYIEQQRQDEAIRLGMRVDGERIFSEADIEREKIRQYEAEIAAQYKAEEERKRSREVLENYRRKEEEVLNYESFGTGHIDFSSEFQKERNLQREAEREATREEYASNNEFFTFSYSPTADADTQYTVQRQNIRYENKDTGAYLADNFKVDDNISSPGDILAGNEENKYYQSSQSGHFSDFNENRKDHQNYGYQAADNIPQQNTYGVDIQDIQYKQETPDYYQGNYNGSFQSQDNYTVDQYGNNPGQSKSSEYPGINDIPEQSSYEFRKQITDPSIENVDSHSQDKVTFSQQNTNNMSVNPGTEHVLDNPDNRYQVNNEFVRNYKEDSYKGQKSVPFYFQQHQTLQNKYDTEKDNSEFKSSAPIDKDDKTIEDRYSRWKKPEIQDSFSPTQYQDNVNSYEEKGTYDGIYPTENKSDNIQRNVGYSNKSEGTFSYKKENDVTHKAETIHSRKMSTDVSDGVKVSDNKHIYESIEQQAKSAIVNGSTAVPVISSVYMDMLKRNVETSRDHWQEVRGTPAEKKAIQEYRAQRKVLDKVKEDVRNDVYRIEKPPVIISEQKKINNIKSSTEPFSEPRPVENNPRLSSYRPGRIVTEPSSHNGMLGTYSRKDRSIPRDNFRYTKEHPLRVSREYKEAIYQKAEEAKESFNYLVEKGRTNKNGPVKISPRTAAEIQTSLDALSGFKKAEKAGVVVVSDESNIKNPDYQLWQQRKYSSYSSGKSSIPGGFGRTSQEEKTSSSKVDKGPKFNSVNDNETSSKEGTQGSFKYFNRRKSDLKDPDILKHKRITRKYLKNISGHAEYYVHRVDRIVSHNVYSLMQTGEDNALSTFEQGRRYISTGISTANVIRNLHVVNSAKIEKLANRLEAAKLSQYGVDSIDELKIDIHSKSALESLRSKERKILLSKENFTKVLKGDPIAIVESKALGLDLYSSGKLTKGLKGEVDFLNKHDLSQVELKIARELEESKRLRVTRRQIAKKIEEKTSAHEAKVKKKFGGLGNDLLKKDAAEFAEEIESLLTKQKDLKSKIKSLESMGSSLKPADRKALKKLKDQHKSNGEKLRKMFGLQKERQTLTREITQLKDFGDQITKNLQVLGNSLRVLSGFISKPFREGDVLAATGLYNAGTFIANRHTRAVIEKSIKASMWVSRHSIDAALIISGNDPRVLHNAVFAGKAKVGAVKQQAKNVVKTSANKVTERTIKTAKDTGQVIIDHTPTRIRTAAGNTKNGISKAKRKIDHIFSTVRSRYQNSLVGRSITSFTTWGGDSIEKFKRIFATTKVVVGKFAFYAVGIYLFLVILISVMGMGMGTVGANGVILSPYDGSDKINLKPYIEILNAEQLDFDTKLNNTVQSKTYRGKTYDKVFINYATSTRNNFKEILSMMAVRLQQDINIEENPEVRQYLKSLYNDSHKLGATESEPYSCSGCIERSYKCTDGLDQYATNERRNLYNQYASRGGCQSETKYCNPRTCTADYHSYYEAQQGECDNYIVYNYIRVCQGHNHHCPGHTSYYCNGHNEKYCRGEHVDLTLTISILTFDEIFSADTMGNAGSTGVAGSLIGYATVTYYCCEKYPHICNGGPPYQTATGTTPTPGRTIAVDPRQIPLGTHVIIDGHEYIAEDTGGAIDNLDIDIAVATHAEALEKGTRYNVPVYNVSYEGAGGQDADTWYGWTAENIEWCKLIYSPNWGELYEGVNDYDGNIEIGDLVVAGNWVWPVTATTASSGFGWRDNPTNPGNQEFHKGTDIPVPEGTPVHAAGDGTVTSAHFSSTAGNMVIIQHANGVTTKYFHNSRLLISAGDTVTAGQVIALSGNTGNSTGPHLHFEFWVNGRVVDPRAQYGL